MFPNLSFNDTNSDLPYFDSDFITDNLDTDMFAYIGSRHFIGEPICFNEGTQILCLNKDSLEEEYKSIENLRKGDLVKTYRHGYKKIHLIGKNTMINNPNEPLKCMYVMKKTQTNNLTQDLYITGGHSILVNDLREYQLENDKIFYGNRPKIDDKYLLLACVNKDFQKVENKKLFTYYHLTLENNGKDTQFGIWANGILAETADNKTFMKHNFRLL
jgi:hypothetical protein